LSPMVDGVIVANSCINKAQPVHRMRNIINFMLFVCFIYFVWCYVLQSSVYLLWGQIMMPEEDDDDQKKRVMMIVQQYRKSVLKKLTLGRR
jgi:hypothetical protein